MSKTLWVDVHLQNDLPEGATVMEVDLDEEEPLADLQLDEDDKPLSGVGQGGLGSLGGPSGYKKKKEKG